MPSRPWSPAPAIRASAWLHAGCVLGAAAIPGAWPWALAALAADHALLGAAGMRPTSRLLGPNLTRLPAASARRGEVALTFDDGPDPAITPHVLALLDRHGARASFFCIGTRAAAHPALVRAIAERGHSVENHSLRHPTLFACYGLRALRRELDGAQRLLAGITGRPPTFFRAPFGLRSPLLDPVLAAAGLRHTAWTRRGHDTVRRDAQAVLRRLTSGLAPGDILLLHDGSAARTPTGQPVVLAVLPALLARLAEAGLRSVSLPMALSAPP